MQLIFRIKKVIEYIIQLAQINNNYKKEINQIKLLEEDNDALSLDVFEKRQKIEVTKSNRISLPFQKKLQRIKAEINDEDSEKDDQEQYHDCKHFLF